MATRAKKDAEAVSTEPSGFKNLHDKLVYVRKNIGAVEKTKINRSINHKYATEEDYYNVVRPLLDEARVMLYASAVGDFQFRDVNTEKRGVVTYVFVVMEYTYVDADTGEAYTVRAPGMGELKDGTGVKSAQTGAARYHFGKQFLISDGFDDEEHVGADRPSQPSNVAPIRQQPAAPARSQASTPPATTAIAVTPVTLRGVGKDVYNADGRDGDTYKAGDEYTYLAYTIDGEDQRTLFRHVFKPNRTTLEQLLKMVGAEPVGEDFIGDFNAPIPAVFKLDRSSYPQVKGVEKVAA